MHHMLTAQYADSAVGCRVMVLGPPLSGKSSQCQLMSHRLGLPHIQVGALLQAKSAAGDEALQSILQGGGLVPDSMYIDAVRERLHHHDCLQSGWLLDGFPHTLAQVGLTLGVCTVARFPSVS